MKYISTIFLLLFITSSAHSVEVKDLLCEDIGDNICATSDTEYDFDLLTETCASCYKLGGKWYCIDCGKCGGGSSKLSIVNEWDDPETESCI